MNIVSVPEGISESTASGIVSQPIKKRSERLQDGTLMLTHNLSRGLKISLKIRNILGGVKITQNDNAREHLPEEEKKYFKHIPDLEAWPTNGIIEVWYPTGNPDEYTVRAYQKIK